MAIAVVSGFKEKHSVMVINPDQPGQQVGAPRDRKLRPVRDQSDLRAAQPFPDLLYLEIIRWGCQAREIGLGKRLTERSGGRASTLRILLPRSS